MFLCYVTDYGRMGTELLLNYWIHGDKVEIGPNCLSHDYLCPMTIWGLIKRSHCLPDWSKNASISWGTTVFIYIFIRSVHPPLARLVQSTKLQNVFFKNGWRSLLRGRRPAQGARIRALLFLVLFEDVSRERPHHIHTDTHWHTHTHFTSGAIHIGKSQATEVKK